MEEFKVPTEKIELPSKGLVYPAENPDFPKAILK
jgi:hypothetical protein